MSAQCTGFRNCCADRRRRIVRAVVDRVIGLLAVGAPVALHLPGRRVDHRDALVEIAVGNVGLVGLRVDEDLRDAAEALLVVAVAREGRVALLVLAAHARVRLAVLREELAVARELDDVRVAGTVAADPDVADVIDEDAVIGIGPVVALARPAPLADETAVGVELEHRRRRRAAIARLQLEALLVVGERLRAAMHDPDVIALIGPHADGVAEHPVIRQRLGPREVDFEARRLHRAAGLRRDTPLDRRLRDAERDEDPRNTTPASRCLRSMGCPPCRTGES